MFYAGVAQWRDMIYVCGVMNENKKVLRYEWQREGQKFAVLVLPSLRIGRSNSSAAVVAGNWLYSVGGCSLGDRYVGTTEKLTLRGDHWVGMPSMNERVGCCTLGVIDSRKLYRIGGYTGQFASYSAAVEWLDLHDEEAGWHFINHVDPWPARELPGCVVNGPNRLLIFGGRSYSQSYDLHNSCYTLEGGLQETHELPYKLQHSCMVSCTQAILVHGQLFCVDNEHRLAVHLDLHTGLSDFLTYLMIALLEY